jgi:hypothetical protein
MNYGLAIFYSTPGIALNWLVRLPYGQQIVQDTFIITISFDLDLLPAWTLRLRGC